MLWIVSNSGFPGASLSNQNCFAYECREGKLTWTMKVNNPGKMDSMSFVFSFIASVSITWWQLFKIVFVDDFFPRDIVWKITADKNCIAFSSFRSFLKSFWDQECIDKLPVSLRIGALYCKKKFQIACESFYHWFIFLADLLGKAGKRGNGESEKRRET